MVLTSTIAISRNTRDLLKELGKKGDTYDELIRQLVDTKKRSIDPLDRRLESLQSSESAKAHR